MSAGPQDTDGDRPIASPTPCLTAQCLNRGARARASFTRAESLRYVAFGAPVSTVVEGPARSSRRLLGAPGTAQEAAGHPPARGDSPGGAQAQQKLNTKAKMENTKRANPCPRLFSMSMSRRYNFDRVCKGSDVDNLGCNFEPYAVCLQASQSLG